MVTDDDDLPLLRGSLAFRLSCAELPHFVTKVWGELQCSFAHVQIYLETFRVAVAMQHDL